MIGLSTTFFGSGNAEVRNAAGHTFIMAFSPEKSVKVVFGS
jgi:hypothetical protein